MTFYHFIAMFSILFIAALIPSVSSMTVFTRTTTIGFKHGAIVSLGVALGDVFYIVIAFVGLSVLSDSMGNFFYLIQYFGGAYIIFLGIVIWRSKSNKGSIKGQVKSSYISSLMLGLIITLSDQKAIIFYLGLLPTLFDLSLISSLEMAALMVVTLTAVGGAKLCYAYIAQCAAISITNIKVTVFINMLAAILLVCIGIYIMINGYLSTCNG